MVMFVLAGVLVVVLGGCACVVWAERGGPRWARAVGSVTLGVGELVRSAGRGGSKRSGSSFPDSSSDDD
ncbi:MULTISPECIES: hypothetical protein [unclassified Streptomyces]|uniref:hypothetical protein n=1 Tax=unclassified Streptomyces TaxID=2593676 RepID=UPI003D764CA5